MLQHGFVRVATAVPVTRVADVAHNLAQHINLLRQAEDAEVDVMLFPECSLTGYTCGDLFQQRTLLEAAAIALRELIEWTTNRFRGLAVVGLPMLFQQQVFNVAAVLNKGSVLGIVPKTYLPNYKEFYDARYFSSSDSRASDYVWSPQLGQSVSFKTNLVFTEAVNREVTVGIEICEDLWTPKPPSSDLALAGANIILNLSASPDTIGKHQYRRELVKQQSARCLAAYVYASSGVGESSTDLVFGGQCLIAEDGVILAESERFSRSASLTIADIDVQHLVEERSQNTSFNMQRNSAEMYDEINFFSRGVSNQPLRRPNPAHPFVPSDPATRSERCEEVFAIQVAGLAKRLEHVGKPTISIGVSGGLDSTLGLLVACKALDGLGVPRTKLIGLTMPGFGTTPRTLRNANALMEALGITARTLDIRQMCFDQWKAMGHSPFGLDLAKHSLESFSSALSDLPAKQNDLTFENVQARMRTSLLMNTAFTVGTGDLSELALGWCTFNADHMSMYNPNVSIPKTLVRSLIRWVAEAEFDGPARETLLDIANTIISPELLPTNRAGDNLQNTEDSVGPYELVDYFLYHFLRWGTPPAKILYLAQQAKFDREYTEAELRHWLKLFFKRFFAAQYKRSCLPDGPKVGSVSLSPRGDWRMPSDAVATAWLAEL
jgi:NAD+ synthase (glutamine-hydrolysing)